MFAKFKQWCKYLTRGYRHPQLMFTYRVALIHGRQYTVRMATNHDIQSMVEIERRIYGDAPWSYAAFQVELQRPHDRLYLVVIDDGQVVGFIGLAVDWYCRDLHITNIGVTPGFQRKGIGTYLIQAAKSYARYLQLHSFSLEVRVHNLNARKLYEHLGFREKHIKHHYYLDNHEDAIEMEVNLLKRGESD